MDGHICREPVLIYSTPCSPKLERTERVLPALALRDILYLLYIPRGIERTI